MPPDLRADRRGGGRLKVHEFFLLPALDKLAERHHDARPVVWVVDLRQAPIEFPPSEFPSWKIAQRAEHLSLSHSARAASFDHVFPPSADPESFFSSSLEIQLSPLIATTRQVVSSLLVNSLSLRG
jgi:hypothetical protein